ncbi:MAG TPA: Os1348 family NHLP clan protein [Vicinamibacterales bacterium]|nr:Os1348 family NHLP clan protein [Vicinamibacterales bacterium]
MAQRNVERLIGQLATDPGLRRRFSKDAAGVIAELLEQGCELTGVEIDALASIDSRALSAFAASLDGRLRRLER